jgi:hypothetical protein
MWNASELLTNHLYLIHRQHLVPRNYHPNFIRILSRMHQNYSSAPPSRAHTRQLLDRAALLKKSSTPSFPRTARSSGIRGHAPMTRLLPPDRSRAKIRRRCWRSTASFAMPAATSPRSGRTPAALPLPPPPPAAALPTATPARR